MTEKATFGLGCFWGPELKFSKIPGVVSTHVGYSGGHTDSPTYQQVCTDQTGHAEVVQLEYDPESIAFEQLLEHFWTMHDPTQHNRQGPDVGTQYRSVIFFHSPEQERAARASMQQQENSGRHRRPIATEIKPLEAFWPAEDYHQRYLEKRGLPSCGLH